MAQKSQLYRCQYTGRGDKAVREAGEKQAQKVEVSCARLATNQWQSCKVIQTSELIFSFPFHGPSWSCRNVTGVPLLATSFLPRLQTVAGFPDSWGKSSVWEFHAGRCCNCKWTTGQQGHFVYVVAQQYTQKLTRSVSNNVVAIV